MSQETDDSRAAARTSLEEMLGAFDGAIVCISHDRAFLDGICNRILEVDGGSVKSYSGNYSFWRERKDEEQGSIAAEKARKAVARAPKPASKAAEPVKKALPGKVKNPWAFEKLEKRIMELETEREKLNASLVTEDVYRNAEKMREAQFRLAELERDLGSANEEWANWVT